MSEMEQIIINEDEYIVGDFHVRDDSTAEWCIKKIKEAQTNKKMWEAHYKAQMERVNTQTQQTVDYFTARLAEYFGLVPHKATKTQESYSLPSAKLIQKKQQPEYKVEDAELVAWLEANQMEDMIKVKKSADWASLKKSVTVAGEHVCTEDGEIVPGVTVTERPEKFEIKMEESENE